MRIPSCSIDTDAVVMVITKPCGCAYLEDSKEYVTFCDRHAAGLYSDKPMYEPDKGDPMKTQDIHEIRMDVAVNDVIFLQEREKEYGSSWKKRGGVGAFMMLARKWDRLENILKTPVSKPGIGSASTYDIFEFLHLNPANVLDDVRDLRRYLLLVEAEMVSREQVHIDKPSEPSPAESRRTSGVLQAQTTAADIGAGIPRAPGIFDGGHGRATQGNT